VCAATCFRFGRIIFSVFFGDLFGGGFSLHIFNHGDITGLQSHQIRWNNAK